MIHRYLLVQRFEDPLILIVDRYHVDKESTIL